MLEEIRTGSCKRIKYWTDHSSNSLDNDDKDPGPQEDPSCQAAPNKRRRTGPGPHPVTQDLGEKSVTRGNFKE